MKPFEFATAQRIMFGRGKLAELSSLTEPLGNSTCVVTGASGRFFDRVTEILEPNGTKTHRFSVAHEPEVDHIVAGCRFAAEHHCKSVIAIGGGSALDAGKAIAALSTNPGAPTDYLELVGKGLPLKNQPAPFIAIPTTSGTGAEVTKNAVLSVPEQRVKVSLRSAAMLPTVAIVDPELTDKLPRLVTAQTGLDALTQLIEPLISCRSNPFTDALCRAAIPLAFNALKALNHDPQSPSARDDLAYAALSSGMALANSGLGAVHGFAGPMGGMFNVPHGALCARLLPFAFQTNYQAIRRQAQYHDMLSRFDEVGQLLTGNPTAKATDAIKALTEISQQLHIPGLASLGITAADISEIIPKAKKASSMKGNPLPLTDEELAEILELAL